MRRADLSAKEQTNVRTALKFLRTRCGGWIAVGRAIGCMDATLGSMVSGRKTMTASLAFSCGWWKTSRGRKARASG